MKNKIDFLKIDGGKLGAVNFNNMLPVQNKNITILDLGKKCITKLEEKYQKMLKEQIYWLNRNSEKLYHKAQKLYERYIHDKMDIATKKRCCDFKLLEEKCIEFNTA